VHGFAKLIEKLRGDELVGDEFWTTVDDAMADGDGRGVNVFANGFGDGGEGVTLRFEDAIALKKRFACCGTDAEGTVGVADAVGAAGE
jgi:hypothetical protein